MIRNVIVGQSGGPTSVINASLAGVYKTAKDLGAKKVYGMRHGIQGFLDKHIIDLDEKLGSDLNVELLKRTPSSYLGSCRFKLPEIRENGEMYDKIFGILEEYEIDAFFYIGGNDSMDTIKKLSDYAILNGSPIRFMGVPKTIDNDLAVTDHTPGFGSAAKYIASVMKELIRDGLVYDMKCATIVEVMGRNAGWLAGAAALAEIFSDSSVLQNALGGEMSDLVKALAFDDTTVNFRQTHGGKVWWKQIEETDKWKIQQNYISQHYRLLTAGNRCVYSSFHLEKVRQAAEEYEKNIE